MIQPVTDVLYLKVTLLSMLFQFYKGLIKSKKFTVHFLAWLQERDLRTVLGQTLDYLVSECGLKAGELEKLMSSLVKRKLRYVAIPVGQEIPDFERSELDKILTHCCTG